MLENSATQSVYFAQWLDYVKNHYSESDPDFIVKQKLEVNDYLETHTPVDITEEELDELLDNIEDCLAHPERLYQEIGVLTNASCLQSGDSPIPGYTLIKRLGQGGYGDVWLATSPGDVQVALKFLPRTSMMSSISTRGEISALQEIKNLNHVNLTPIAALWEEENKEYVIYQMALSDYSLYDLFKKRSRASKNKSFSGFSFKELYPYFKGAASALDFLNHPSTESHRPGIVHGDIKPQNIFVTQDSVRVGDFGSVCTLDETGFAHSRPGSAPFKSPESFNDKVTAYSDQYSLAICWYYLRTGHLPFIPEGKEDSIELRVAMTATMSSDFAEMNPNQIENFYREAHLKQAPDLSLVSPHEQKVLRKALDKDPSKRYKTTTEFVKALEKPSWILPIIIVCLCIATALGIYGHYSWTMQKQAEQKRLAAEEAYQAVAVNTIDTFVSDILSLVQFEPVLDHEKAEWDRFIEKLKKYPNSQKENVQNYLKQLQDSKNNFSYFEENKVTNPLDKHRTVLLTKKEVELVDIDAFYKLYPSWQVDLMHFFDSLKVATKNLEHYIEQGKELDPLSFEIANQIVDVEYKSDKKNLEFIYFSNLEVLFSFPEKAKLHGFDLINRAKSMKPCKIINDTPLTLTSKQYGQMGRDSLKAEQNIIESFKDFCLHIDETHSQLIEEDNSLQKKQEKVDSLEKELSDVQKQLLEKDKKGLEKFAFSETDTQWKKFGKLVVVGSIYLSRKILVAKSQQELTQILKEKGLSDVENEDTVDEDLAYDGNIVYIGDVLFKMLDQLIEEYKGEDENFVTLLQSLKLYYQLPIDKRWSGSGLGTYQFENNQEHPNLKCGDIVLKINNQLLRVNDDFGKYGNKDKNLPNTFTVLRFSSDSKPEIFEYQKQPNSPGPRVGFVEIIDWERIEDTLPLLDELK